MPIGITDPNVIKKMKEVVTRHLAARETPENCPVLTEEMHRQITTIDGYINFPSADRQEYRETQPCVIVGEPRMKSAVERLHALRHAVISPILDKIIADNVLPDVKYEIGNKLTLDKVAALGGDKKLDEVCGTLVNGIEWWGHFPFPIGVVTTAPNGGWFIDVPNSANLDLEEVRRQVENYTGNLSRVLLPAEDIQPDIVVGE